MATTKDIRLLVTDAIRAGERGRKYTDARNAYVAYGVIALEMAQADLVRETGLDKSDVSRVVKQAKAIDGFMAALAALDRSGKPDARDTAAAALGAQFLRRTRKTSSKPGEGETTGEGESNATTGKPSTTGETFDIVAAAYDAILNAATDKQREALVAAVTEAMRTAVIDAKRALEGKAAR